LLIFWYSFFSMRKLPFKLPVFCDKLDPNNPLPGNNNPGESSGIYFFGNDIVTKEHLWFNNSDMRTHVLIFGSTGAGKTEALLSIAYNALAQGSGFIYVDGKGDNSLFAKVFSMVRASGREDDLLLINFMTGASDIIGPQEHVLSNTMNPFAAGSSSMLSQLVVSLMDSGGGSGGGDGDMWKGRAISFVQAIMPPLVWLRDKGYLLLDAGLIRRYFVLDVLEELLFDNKIVDQDNNTKVITEKMPFDVYDPLENYLATLPGYQKADKGKQSGKAYEQHGYITMQLTRIFGSLANVYSHIIRTNLAEVDFRDVVLNRRILVVLLPALEKAPDELASLGKLIIASLRAMLAEGLGSKVEGDYADVIETKPTNSKTPYLCVLDEYGYYAVKGFAVVPAQARSLGFSVVFAGQDLPAFQKASKEEAASICANTNIKICMKLEDPVETWDFFNKTAGEAYVSVTRSFSRQGGGAGLDYRDSMEAQFDKRSRLSLLDLKDQREGEAHIFFKSKIVRASMFYASPAKVKKIKLNQFLKVKPPADTLVSNLTKLRSASFVADTFKREGQEEGLAALFTLFKSEISKERTPEIIKSINRFVEGHVDEEKIDFGNQANNPSIFMQIPIDQRLASQYFDVEISNLQDSLLTKEKLYEVVKKLNIIEGKSESVSKQESLNIIKRIETETSYQGCLPIRQGSLVDNIDTLLKKVV
jgi:intracellular multiplication protein IcmO